jgi:hypothetical protein
MPNQPMTANKLATASKPRESRNTATAIMQVTPTASKPKALTTNNFYPQANRMGTEYQTLNPQKKNMYEGLLNQNYHSYNKKRSNSASKIKEE